MNKIEAKQHNAVTIVIPTFNRCEFLKEAIDSALSQTHKCEVIVCDHGSTDNTPDMIKKYGTRLKYIRRENDFGPHFCWLEGVLHANSEYIHIQFDDDWIRETFIERCLELMGPDVGVVIAESSGIFNFKEKFVHSGLYPSRKLEKLLLSGIMYSPGASLFRKKELLDGLYQGDLPISKFKPYHGVGPDSFFTYLAVLRYKKVGVIVDDLVFFREHENSITCDAKSDVEKQFNIENAYRDVTSFYLFLKWYWFFNKLKFLNFHYLIDFFIFHLVRFLKKFGLYENVRKLVRRFKNN
jgi:glycosyltransferase involved in cell wall biosynthesis